MWKITSSHEYGSLYVDATNPVLYHSIDKGAIWSADSETFYGDTVLGMYWLNARQGWIASYAHSYRLGHIWYYDPSSGVTAPTSANKTESPVSVYPNPAATSFRTFYSHSKRHLRILDALGRTVLDRSSSSSSEPIDVSQFSNGVYEILISQAGAERVSRLVVQQ